MPQVLESRSNRLSPVFNGCRQLDVRHYPGRRLFPDESLKPFIFACCRVAPDFDASCCWITSCRITIKVSSCRLSVVSRKIVPAIIGCLGRKLQHMSRSSEKSDFVRRAFRCQCGDRGAGRTQSTLTFVRSSARFFEPLFPKASACDPFHSPDTRHTSVPSLGGFSRSSPKRATSGIASALLDRPCMFSASHQRTRSRRWPAPSSFAEFRPYEHRIAQTCRHRPRGLRPPGRRFLPRSPKRSLLRPYSSHRIAYTGIANRRSTRPSHSCFPSCPPWSQGLAPTGSTRCGDLRHRLARSLDLR